MLRTRHLVLRDWCGEDRDGFAAMMADPAVVEFLMPPADRAACDAWVDRAQANIARHGFGLWAVEIPGEAPFIGCVGLTAVSFAAPFTPAIEIAWRLARPHWGRGYAGEAASAALDYAFDGLGLGEIVAMTVPDNRRSRRVMERLGMTRLPEDDFDHPLVPQGHPLRRHVLYRLRRSVPQPAARGG